MGRTKGTYTLTSNIEPKVGAPLDARTIVKLLADLTASNTFEYPYKGMKVFVEENNKSYTLVGSDPTVSTNWIEDNSGGHTIKNSAGTSMTQRSNLQFVDLTVSDDSINDVTKVENIHVIQSESELENLPDGLYMLDDDEDTVIDGNLVGYDNTDSELNAENVQDAIDEVVETLDDKIDISTKGVANGVAELDTTGKVPSSQLPSFVDDVIEVADYDHLPATGETGKIYVTLDANKTYRWGGTEYVEISESLALGETSSTAYRGDRGKTAYDHSQLTSGNPHNVTKSDIGLDNVDNTSDSTKKTNFTGSIASGNTGFVTGGDTYTALNNKVDKVSSATNGNLAGLNGSGNLTDSGWNGAKDTTSISGNPISISGLKANQLAINPIITLEPIQDLHGQSKPYPAGGGKNKLNMSDKTISGADWVFNKSECVLSEGTYIFSWNVNLSTSNSCEFQVYDSAGNTIIADVTSNIQTPIQFTITQTAGYCRFYAATGGTFSKFMIRLSTETDATFAPYENICPISGYDKVEVLSCGKNLLDLSKIGSYQVTESGIMRYGIPAYLKAGTYTFSKSGGSATLYLTNVTDNYSYVEIGSAQYPYTFSVNTNSYVLFRTSGNTPSDWDIVNAQLEEGSSVTIYEPCIKATSISESLGQTVYGGTLDVRTGKFTVGFVKKVYDGSSDETWTKDRQSFYIADNTLIKELSYTTNIIKCDRLETVDRHSLIVLGDVTDAVSGYKDTSTQYSGQNWIYIGVNGISNVESLKTWLSNNPIEVVFELADSAKFTIQLIPHEIPLLKDYAYVSTNGTTISLDYHNGELASLSDVAQVGETVNELGEYIGAVTDNNYVDCSACSTIYSIFETIMQGQSKLKSTAYGVGNIGALQNTNLKTLLGNPGLTNYVHAYIRPIVSGTNFMKLAEVYAVSTVNTQSAIKRKYIWMSQSSASQSAWETINYMT